MQMVFLKNAEKRVKKNLSKFQNKLTCFVHDGTRKKGGFIKPLNKYKIFTKAPVFKALF